MGLNDVATGPVTHPLSLSGGIYSVSLLVSHGAQLAVTDSQTVIPLASRFAMNLARVQPRFMPASAAFSLGCVITVG